MADRKPPDETATAQVLAAGAAPDAGRPSTSARSLGPEDLKAFTHPLRMAMYTALRDQGSATASQLARRLGESSGQTSYHLRQLERHGFVEDDPEHTGRRDRWWRAVGFSVEDRTLLDDPASALAVRTLLDQDVADRTRVLRRWADGILAGGGEVDDAATMLGAMTTEMTRAEAEQMIREVQVLLGEHLERAKARRADGDREGRRRTRIYFDVVPLPVEDAGRDRV